MKKIKAETLSDMQNYKLLSGSIIPRPIAFVTTQNLKGISTQSRLVFLM